MEKKLLLSFYVSFCICFSVVHSSCTSPIYCQGPFLTRLQQSGVESDSKTLVDMPLRRPVDEVLSAFSLLPFNTSKAEYLEFVNKWMYPAGYEVQEVVPLDWTPNPKFLQTLPEKLKLFGQSLHSKWKELIRSFNTTGLCEGCFSSIPVPNPFVVAGGRFREYYYWDSFWIVQGLLVSDMKDTAKGFIENMLYLVDTFGFIPNGGRIYYLNRSQPPMLTQMVYLYYQATNDNVFLKRAMPTLEKEYQFWMNRRSIVAQGLDGNYYTVNRYQAETDQPRPESYREDIQTANSAPGIARPAIYKGLASGAESGWDFSSRWMSDWNRLSSIRTNEILPVDLNSILYDNERKISELYNILGNNVSSSEYSYYAISRKNAIKNLLWNWPLQTWSDFIYSSRTGNPNFYPSNFLPIWSGAYHQSPEKAFQVIKSQWSSIMYPGGIPTSLIANGEQWDFPNGWAPLQQFVVDALDKLAEQGVIEASKYADKLASAWITTNYCAWLKSIKDNGKNNSDEGLFYEKYDVTTVGGIGSGGEYQVQAGFGWTNGVLLKLLHTRGSRLHIGSCP